MRPLPSSALCYFILLVCPLVTAISIDCSDASADGKHFNLEALNAPYSLYTIVRGTPVITNTTFAINFCRPLKKLTEEECPNGTYVCARELLTNTAEHKEMAGNTIPIAGEYYHLTGDSLDPKWTRLKTSASNSDREKEGLRLEMSGPKFEKVKQKAIIEFICKPDTDYDRKRRRSGSDFFGVDNKAADEDKDPNEGADDGDDDEEEDKSGEITDDGHGGKLKYISWDTEKDQTRVLRLQWDTKYVCEDAENLDDDKSSSGHWGIFTWFIIIAFMGVAAYLIFGSWLNYNRYSARGWDLLPHSETIRDIPYLFRDWMRRVVNTVQGGGSRGGYSAV